MSDLARSVGGTVAVLALLLGLPAAATGDSSSQEETLSAPHPPEEPVSSAEDSDASVGVIYPTAAAIGNEFLSGAQAVDEAIQTALPLGKSMAGSRVDELPLPVGLAFSYNHQWEKLRITRLDVSLAGSAPISVPADLISEIKASTNTYALTLDVWVLPFWGIFGIVGYSDGVAQIEVEVPGVLDQAFDQRYSVVTYGGGTTLTGGWRDFFVVGNLAWTTQDVDLLESNVNVFIASPRVGWQSTVGPAAVALWAGANYLHIGEHLYGNIDFDIPGLGPTNIGYDLDIQEIGAWNAALGGRAALGKRFDLVVEGGIGRRRSILASLAFRF